jgi:hypothetical protein
LVTGLEGTNNDDYMLVTPAVEPSEGMLNAMDEVNLDLMMC